MAAIMVVVAGTALASLPASPAVAAPGAPFSLDEPTVFVAQGNDRTRLYRAVADESTGEWAFEPYGAEQAFRYNALAFNPDDGYLYAVVEGDGAPGFPERGIVRIGQEGVATYTGRTLPGTAVAWSGEFNTDDGYYYPASSTGGTYWRVDVSTPTPTVVATLSPASSGVPVFDFVYADGYFWGLDGDVFKRIHPATGAATSFPVPASWGLPSGSYGAAWRFGNGNLGFSLNGGTVFQFAVENPASASPTFTFVARQPGPASSRNDGASIPGLPTDLEVHKSAPAHLEPGGTTTYEITVANNGPGVSSGWSVVDELPAGLSFLSVSGDVSWTVIEDAVVVSGGRLPAGGTRTFTVTAQVDPGVAGCLTNTAVLVPNEADPNSTDNTGTAESCVPELAVTKTSDATADTRIGDTVTYTVTLTNTGQAAYTEDLPAVVVDDLTDVLAHATYNDDAAASRPGALSRDGSLLRWSGPLAVGDSVELTYSMTVTNLDDRRVRNVAWVPDDPTTPGPTAPGCGAVVDGRDVVTGEPCAGLEVLLPALRVTKTADRTELPVVGADVTYTLVVENVGPGDYTATAPARVTDDLAGVLDDATFNDDAVATYGDATAAPAPTLQGDQLTWSGPLPAGEVVEITYTVHYEAGGDALLRNVACVAEGETAPGNPRCAFVNIPAADLAQWKQVTASTDPVVAGTVLRYELFFHNEGTAPATVAAVDHLEHVLDDADLTEAPASADGLTTAVVGDEIHVAGTVPSGETYSVVYEVTVRPDGVRGDDVAVNFLLAQADPPPPGPVCDPADARFADCTSTPVAAVTYAKSVQASTDPVGTGTVLRYTITVDSTGTDTGVVNIEDVLTGVLDDAELTVPPTSDTPTVIASPVTGERFRVTGELVPGARAHITYEVTVRPEDERGDDVVANFLVPPGGTPGVCGPADTTCTSTPLPAIGVTKSSDPAPGAVVTTDDEVTYTLTFVNDGEAPGAVDHVDHLDGVLDDAELIGAPTASDAALIVADGPGRTLRVTGTLAPHQQVTVTYTVRVLDARLRGDHLLANVLAPAGVPDPECTNAGVVCTSHPMPSVTVDKSADPAPGTSVTTGEEVTYTLTFRNDGTAPGDVHLVDDLTHVLDDADLVGGPASGSPVLTVVRDGARLVVDGTLAGGQSAVVTYTVRVLPATERGDDVLANFLLHPAEGTPPEPVCDPVAGALGCTVHPVSDLVVAKSVDPASGTTVTAGEEVTYTLTFINAGSVTVGVDHVDHLSGVLDDADLVGEPVADPGLTVARAPDSLAVVGEVAAGATASVRYTVLVRDHEDRGDHHLANFLVTSGAPPPVACAADDTTCTVNPVVTPDGGGGAGSALARTGAPLAAVAVAAFLALAVGAWALVVSRRRHAQG